ncbi:molybdopterin-dependent oxidoreductase [Halioxenophilus sp. WMMB6]|uniref:molybdopterin-dependent oxidoreductase n=1 Tax=Halioxenophilus sp. WMMB6 TaxID=3073815 RepID=UPI00295E8903|nr:molybdopterin-dependent oxidoreductase [Halioxenophilus sp. WMMB6]
MSREPQLPPRQQLTDKFPLVGEQRASTELTTDNWRLTITDALGRVQQLTFAELLALPQTDYERPIHCVTRWSRLGDRFTGVLLADLVAELGLDTGALFVRFVAYSARNHDTSLPTAVCLQEAVMLVHAINGQPLAPEHGFPVRTFAPTRYFYKSLKWLQAIEFIEQDQLGFWERGGYHNNADYRSEQRYVTGNLTGRELEKLRQAKNFKKYQGQVLISLDLSNLDLTGMNLQGVQLKNCNLDGCKLAGANLSGANLSNSSLMGADLTAANLAGADLDGVLFMGATLINANFDGTFLNATEFIREGLPAALVAGMHFQDAQCSGLISRQLDYLLAHGAQSKR